MTRVRIEGRSEGRRVEIRRESLMVGPIAQLMAVSESRAAWRAWASRWPRQMLIIRCSGVPVVVRAWAKGAQRGWRGTGGLKNTVLGLKPGFLRAIWFRTGTYGLG